MKTTRSILLAFFLSSSAFATQYAAPAMVDCSGTQYDVKVQTRGLSTGDIAMEFEDTEIVLFDKAAKTAELIANDGAGYDVDDKKYVYTAPNSEDVVMTVKPKFMNKKRATAVFHLPNGKILKYSNCKLYMTMPRTLIHN